MPLVPLNMLGQFAVDTVVNRRKVIGYGAFPPARVIYPLKPDYVVHPNALSVPDIDRPYWQQESFETLAKEDPKRSTVIMYEQDWDAAVRTMVSKGNNLDHFPLVPFFSLEYLYRFMPTLQALPVNYARERKAEKAKRAIIIRGAITNEYPVRVIQKIANDHPDDLIIVSTWDDTAPKIKEVCGALADKVVFCKKPPVGGIKHRNYQSIAIQEGLKAIGNAPVEKVLIMRNDHLFCVPSLLDLLGLMHTSAVRSLPAPPKLQERLLVMDFGTQRYLPYHVSDMLTYGTRADVEQYWLNQPQDAREYTVELSKEMLAKTQREACRAGFPTESYFASNFLKEIGVPLDYSIDHSLSVLRDYFVVADSASLMMLWVRKFMIDHHVLAGPLARRVTSFDWQALHGCAKLAEANDDAMAERPMLDLFAAE